MSTLDFIMGLSKTKKHNDSIMVVVDKLSKKTHFNPVKSTYKIVEISKIFVKEIFQFHGIPKVVISDKNVKFTSTFWKALFIVLGMQDQFSTAYYLQKDGKTEWVN